MIKYFLVEKYEKKRASKNSTLYLEYEGTNTSKIDDSIVENNSNIEYITAFDKEEFFINELSIFQ